MAQRAIVESVLVEQSVGTQLRPSMGASANLYEVGWTDEARQAAQVARRVGYKKLTKSSRWAGDKSTRTYEHPQEGHRLTINAGTGAWKHVTSHTAGGAVPPDHVERGRGAGDLRLHLGQVHGTLDDDRESAALSAQPQLVRASLEPASPWGMGPGGAGYEEGREVGWTDEARAAAAVAKAAGYKHSATTDKGSAFMTLKRPSGAVRKLNVHPDGSWTHSSGHAGDDPVHGQGSDELDEHLGKLRGMDKGDHEAFGGGSSFSRGGGPSRNTAPVLRSLSVGEDEGFNRPRIVRATLDPGVGEKPQRTGSGPVSQGHDDTAKVPVRAFMDDVRHKLRKRKVMPGGALDQDANPKGPSAAPDKQNEQRPDDGPVDGRGVPVPGEPIYSKEQTNYRYAADPKRSCGECRFFREPASCRLVMGLILKTDTCDKFEDDDGVKAAEKEEEGAMGRVVRAQLVTESFREAWSDEARKASVLARQHGYNLFNRTPRTNSYAHEDGHRLDVHNDGSWSHREFELPMKPGENGKLGPIKAGLSSDALHDRLTDVHGPAEDPVRPAREVGWTDEARQAAREKLAARFSDIRDTHRGMPRNAGGTHPTWERAAGKFSDAIDQHGDRAAARGATPEQIKDDVERAHEFAQTHDDGPANPALDRAFEFAHLHSEHYNVGQECAMREVGWTDEARQASVLARQRGYRRKAQDPSITRTPGQRQYVHPKGHALFVDPNGKWTHVKGLQKGNIGLGEWPTKAGHSADSLARRLSDVHGGVRECACREAAPWFARHKNGEAIGLGRALEILKGMEAVGYESPLGEVSPPGWEGTVKHMKKHKDISNPWALAWYMKGRGYTPHKEMAPFDRLLDKAKERRREGAPSMDFQRPRDRGLAPTGRLDNSTNVSFRQSEDESKDAKGHGSEPRHGMSNHYSVLSAKAGGEGARSVVGRLKAQGIRSRATSSPYVDHEGVEVLHGDKRTLDRAGRHIFGREGAARGLMSLVLSELDEREAVTRLTRRLIREGV